MEAQMRILGTPLLLLALVAGCADGSAEPSDEPSPAPAFDTRPDQGGPRDGFGLGLVGVRTAHHPGYDRVVFELDGSGDPGWRVEYTTDPVHDGSGEPVPLEGSAYHQVALWGIGIPDDTGIPAFADDATRLPGTGTSGVAEIAPGSGPFEGVQDAFIGLTGAPRPFRVVTLEDPARVVVDIRDD